MAWPLRASPAPLCGGPDLGPRLARTGQKRAAPGESLGSEEGPHPMHWPATIETRC
jgi:hypothetical protein